MMNNQDRNLELQLICGELFQLIERVKALEIQARNELSYLIKTPSEKREEKLAKITEEMLMYNNIIFEISSTATKTYDKTLLPQISKENKIL